MNKLTDRLAGMKSSGKKALSLFVTAGIPNLNETAEIILALANNGADLIELGIPFSDPIADGPTIQASSDLARKNGATLETTFAIAREVRKSSDIPLILMGYANPVYRMGLEPFVMKCRETGIDGTILADIPIEESAEYVRLTRENGVAGVFLAAPTTSDERLRKLDEITEGFLYCVSVTGVTGTRRNIVAEAAGFLERAQKHVIRHPLLAGFGIATPDDAKQLSRYCDGVIIGSALIKILMANKDAAAVTAAVDFIRPIRQALDTAA